MKTTFFKHSLPVFAILLAIGGAFAFQKPAHKELLPEAGWINLPGNPCAVETQCNTDDGPACMLFYNGQNRQAFGKNSITGECTEVLSRPVN
ncbi:DUF6520 family protein [Flavobacterium gelatinilyticum]|uniref:DUF6520 family protein n=1 Tax=Flavobacterium gelatinilyticum TaxID=3003260 RepID=UPI00248019B8|nr:DUF6520 family protein [Flavobacterium gelatinilyticum]